MVGWHHRLDGRELEQAPGVGDGQRSLACCSLWDCKESGMSEWLNWTELLSHELSKSRCFQSSFQQEPDSPLHLTVSWLPIWNPFSPTLLWPGLRGLNWRGSMKSWVLLLCFYCSLHLIASHTLFPFHSRLFTLPLQLHLSCLGGSCVDCTLQVYQAWTSPDSNQKKDEESATETATV